MKYKIDLTGNRYGRLTVIEYVYTKNRKPHWRCRCDCGNETIVSGSNLRYGVTKSCGCLEEENRKRHVEESRKHGESYTRLHKAWTHMKYRCHNPKAKGYEIYGGRGITVCEEWDGEHGYENFSQWAKNNGYEDGLTLDRIDVNGNYEPNNCRWSTAETQANNRRTNVILTANGVSKTRAEWCRERGINYGTVVDRMKNGWTAEEALEFAERPQKSGGKIKRHFFAETVVL